MTRRKPLTKSKFPKMQPIEGLKLATGACGVAYRDRADLMLAELQKGTQIAGVFTRSLTASAPVKWCRSILPGGTVRAVIVNAGNANAFTGRAGDDIVRAREGGVRCVDWCDRSVVFAKANSQ